MTQWRSARARSVSRQALMMPPMTTTAVPCWSSWKMGMSVVSLRRRSISKQRGAEMSSRLTPPKVGVQELHGPHDLVRVLRVQADGEGIHPGEGLEEHALALHHGHGGLRADVAQTQDGRPVGDDGHQVPTPRVDGRPARGRGGSRGRARPPPACRPWRGRACPPPPPGWRPRSCLATRRGASGPLLGCSRPPTSLARRLGRLPPPRSR